MRELTIREGYIPVMRGRVWYRVAQSMGGIPLMMLHGGTVAASGYFPPLLAMAEERPVVLYEHLEGVHLHGAKAQKEGQTAADGAGFARFLREMDQIQVTLAARRLHVLGYSWGAPLALEYALHRPRSVASLIVDLVEPAPLRRGPSDGLPGEGQGRLSLVEKLAELSRTGRLQQISAPALFLCGWRADCQPELTGWYGSLLPDVELLAVQNVRRPQGPGEDGRFVERVNDFLHRAERKAGPLHAETPLGLAA